MALKVCNDRHCPEVTDQPYCPRHAREKARERPRRGSTYQWRRIREQVLRRDNHRCFYCGKRANSVDHRKPLAAGGTDDLDNLVAACAECNLRKGAGHAPM